MRSRHPMVLAVAVPSRVALAATPCTVASAERVQIPAAEPQGRHDDALSVRLFESASHIVVFGVSHGIDQAPFPAAAVAALQKLLEPLAKAARLHTELGSLGWEPAIALGALDQLAAALIVADSDGRGHPDEPGRRARPRRSLADRGLRRGDKPLAPPFVRHGQAAQAEAGEGFRAVSRAFEALD
jgi:hypothetical protein